MPSKSESLATLRPELGSMMEFDTAMQRMGYIGYRVLPILEVGRQSGSFGKVPVESLAKVDDVTRTSKGDYNRTDWKFGDDDYITKEYGLEGPVDRRNAAMYRDYFDAEAATAEIVLHKVLTAAEQRVAAAVFNTTTWTGSSLTTSVSVEWSTAATATPIANVRAAALKVRNNSGFWPNALIINKIVFRNLQDCATVIERIHASGAGNPVKPTDITAAMLAQVFDLDEVIVADGVYDSAKEGQAASLTDIWDDEYAMVCKIGKTSNIAEACIGRTFHWSEDGSQPGGLVESYYDERVRADVLRVRHEVHEKIIYPECGHLLQNITA